MALLMYTETPFSLQNLACCQRCVLVFQICTAHAYSIVALYVSACNVLFQAQADRVAFGNTAQSLSASYRDEDVPVSIYSEAALKGQYGSSVYGSHITGAAAFARNSDFSKSISEYSKIMDADSLPMAAEV